ncbi:MAG: hypothetical protein SPK18_00675 [Treponema sp.]|nr:hypothetical protein [Treponema sp.]MDY5757081.1 hypothetical protein [Treponema sp.]
MDCVSAIVGSLTGGIISLIICLITIRHDKENVRFDRFRRICDEFDTCKDVIDKNASQSGDEVAHKDFAPHEIEKILFLLSEIEKIVQKDNSYLEAFYNLNEDSLRNLLHEKRILDKVKLDSDGTSVFHLTKNGENSNKIYALVQSFFLRLAELNK